MDNVEQLTPGINGEKAKSKETYRLVTGERKADDRAAEILDRHYPEGIRALVIKKRRNMVKAVDDLIEKVSQEVSAFNQATEKHKELMSMDLTDEEKREIAAEVEGFISEYSEGGVVEKVKKQAKKWLDRVNPGSKDKNPFEMPQQQTKRHIKSRVEKLIGSDTEREKDNATGKRREWLRKKELIRQIKESNAPETVKQVLLEYEMNLGVEQNLPPNLDKIAVSRLVELSLKAINELTTDVNNKTVARDSRGAFRRAWLSEETLSCIQAELQKITKLIGKVQGADSGIDSGLNIVAKAMREKIENVNFFKENPEILSVEKSNDILIHECGPHTMAQVMISGTLMSRQFQPKKGHEKKEGSRFDGHRIEHQLYFNSLISGIEEQEPQAHTWRIYQGEVSTADGSKQGFQAFLAFPKRILLAKERQFFVEDGLALFDKTYENEKKIGLGLNIQEECGLLVITDNMKEKFEKHFRKMWRHLVLGEEWIPGENYQVDGVVSANLQNMGEDDAVDWVRKRMMVITQAEYDGDPRELQKKVFKELQKRYAQTETWKKASLETKVLVPSDNSGEDSIGNKTQLYRFVKA